MNTNARSYLQASPSRVAFARQMLSFPLCTSRILPKKSKRALRY